MKRRIIPLIIIILISCTYFGRAIYAYDQSDLDRLNGQAQNALKEQNEIKGQISNERSDLDKINDQLDSINNEIINLQSQLDSLNDSIVAKQEEINVKQKDLEEKQELLKKRLVAMYKNGGVKYLDVLLGSSSYMDMLASYDALEKIADADTKLINKVASEKQSLEDAKTELEKQKAEVDSVKSQKEAKNVELTAMQKQKNNKIASLTEEQKATQKKLDQYRAAIAQAEKEIEEARKNAGGSNSGYVDNSKGNLGWPLPSSYARYAYITSYFGPRKSPTAGASSNHGAIDIGVAYQPVYAAEAGTVIMAQAVSGYGNFIMIWHSERGQLYTTYAHLNQYKVYAGQKVSRGQQIAVSGNTGITTGPHLHFEVRAGGSSSKNRVDPLNYVTIY